MIRLIVADDHPIVRQGLLRIVETCPDMTVVGEAADGDSLMALLGDTEADVLLLDISMPGPPFVELMLAIRDRWPSVRLLVVSTHAEDQYAVRALKAGAVGYLSKDRSPQELTRAVRHVYQGGRYVSDTLAERLALRLDPRHEAPSHESLSRREFDVLCMLGAGRSVKEIAEALSLSSKTVSTYRARILDKLQLQNTAQLIRYAVEHKLTDQPGASV